MWVFYSTPGHSFSVVKVMNYYPCILNCSEYKAKKKIVGPSLTREDVIEFLRKNCWNEWLVCDALPEREDILKCQGQ